MEKTAYEQAEKDLINEYIKSIKNGTIYSTTKDLDKASVSKKHENWIRKISELNPKEYDVSAMEKIDKEIVLEITLDILIKIFGENIGESYIEYLKSIEVTNQKTLLDGMASKVGIKNPETNNLDLFDITFIPNINYLSSVVVLIHEFMHYYTYKKEVNEGKKRYYNEILSLYGEKYAINYLSELVKNKEFLKVMESTRVEGILWHYIISPSEMETIIKLYRTAKNNKDYQMLYQIEKDLPQLFTEEGIKYIKSYRKCLADSYGIGYLFADALYKKGLDDSSILRTNISSYYNGDKSLQEILNYYNISTTNFKLYDDTYDYLKKVLK